MELSYWSCEVASNERDQYYPISRQNIVGMPPERHIVAVQILSFVLSWLWKYFNRQGIQTIIVFLWQNTIPGSKSCREFLWNPRLLILFCLDFRRKQLAYNYVARFCSYVNPIYYLLQELCSSFLWEPQFWPTHKLLF